MREGGLMQMGREGSRQRPLPRSSVSVLPLGLLLVSNKLLFRAGAGDVSQVTESELCT